MTLKKNTFSKKERVKSKKKISQIFNDGIFFYSELLSVGIYENKNTNQKFHKIITSVPKKLFKSAVKRNKIKRLIREAYRLNKNILYNVSEKSKIFYDIIFIYQKKEIPDFRDIEKDVILLLHKIVLEKKS